MTNDPDEFRHCVMIKTAVCKSTLIAATSIPDNYCTSPAYVIVKA